MNHNTTNVPDIISAIDNKDCRPHEEHVLFEAELDVGVYREDVFGDGLGVSTQKRVQIVSVD